MAERAKRSSTKRTPAKRAKAPSRKTAKVAKRSGAPRRATPAKTKARPASTRPSKAVKAPKSAARAKKGEASDRVVVQNVNVPGYRSTVDARKYHAMRDTLLAALPRSGPGLTQAEMFEAVEGKLPEAVFPGQEKSGWWVKCVQLDLEAKGVMARSATKPLRWTRVG